MRYEVEFLDVWNGAAPNFDTVEQLANSHVKLWDNIVRIPTIEEQVGLICNAGIPASAVVYALGDVYGEFIPQHVHDKARAELGGGGPVIGAVTTGRTSSLAAAPTGASRVATGRTSLPPAPQVQAAPPPEEAHEVAPTPAPASVAAAAAAPFDPQPTHAEEGRSKKTVEALARVRNRSRQTS